MFHKHTHTHTQALSFSRALLRASTPNAPDAYEHGNRVRTCSAPIPRTLYERFLHTGIPPPAQHARLWTGV